MNKHIVNQKSIRKISTFKMNTDNLDFVYIIKLGEKGDELRYSLRSIEKYYPNHKIWIVGYKPNWLRNINYLPVEQKGNKWSNSVNNIIQACKCEEISEDFILMNDDFYCINPIFSLEEIINSNLGLLEGVINKYKKQKSEWAKGFIYINELLKELNIKEPLYSYEAHLPLKINKQKFLEVINLPKVQEFMKTSKVLHKRTLYKNYDKPENSMILKSDTKITLKKDNSMKLMEVCGWLSTADGVLNNSKFLKLNKILKENLVEPCKFEQPLQTSMPIKKKDKYLKF